MDEEGKSCFLIDLWRVKTDDSLGKCRAQIVPAWSFFGNLLSRATPEGGGTPANVARGDRRGPSAIEETREKKRGYGAEKMAGIENGAGS